MEIIMSSAGSQDFELDEAFVDVDLIPEVLSKSLHHSKASLLKRRLIDDILQEKRLQAHLKEYDFDLEDD
jgi:hypothetical protein